MPNMLPRLLYILAALAWFLLLRPNPVTIVMAGCFACLTLPVYRRMRCTIRHWRKRLRLRHPGRLGHIVISCSHRLPLYGYIVMIFSAVVIPISTLVLLVSPQVAGGLARLRELQANNFQLPPEWVMRFQELRHSLADYPKVDKMISEFLSNLDAMLADTMGLLINRSVDVLGGTMTVLWTLFLFVTLTVIFAAYASRINLITARIFHIPATMLRRFVLAIRRALQGVMHRPGGPVRYRLCRGGHQAACLLGAAGHGRGAHPLCGHGARLGPALSFPLVLRRHHARRGPGPLGHAGRDQRGQHPAPPVPATGHQCSFLRTDHRHPLRSWQFWSHGAHHRPRAAGHRHAGCGRSPSNLPPYGLKLMFHSPSTPGRWLCVLLLVLAMLSLPAGADAARRARAAVMINLSNGKVLYEHNPNLSIPPASLTKVMTMYVVMDRIKMGRLKRNTSIRVHPTARVGGSSMRLRPRQRVTVDQLLTGMAVASGNDAAMAISQHISGNSRNFTHLMNHKARQLGMTRTVFKNPTGLPAAGQRTTARDMATLARAYLRSHPQAMRYHSLRSFRFNGRTLGATNTMLGIPGVDGLKTGWTVASGYNIIVTARRGKTRLLVVVMGGRSRAARDMVAHSLIEAGFKAPASPQQVRKRMRGVL